MPGVFGGPHQLPPPFDAPGHQSPPPSQAVYPSSSPSASIRAAADTGTVS
jgi:hypothetical protein